MGEGVGGEYAGNIIRSLFEDAGWFGDGGIVDDDGRDSLLK